MSRYQVDDRPACFGVEYAASNTSCHACAYKESCQHVVSRWSSRKSLSEVLVDMELLASAESVPAQPTLTDLYCFLYSEHFGRAPRKDRDWKWRSMTTLGRVKVFCSREGIDPAVWISAQMHAMRDFLAKRGLTFQVNMLSPTRSAKRRYNIHVSLGDRLYRRGASDTFNYRTDLGVLRDELTVDETRVATYYVSRVVAGASVTWEQAIEEADPGYVWLDADAYLLQSYYMTPSRSGKRIGVHRLKAAKRLAAIRSAVVIAGSYDYRLPDRVGFEGNFKWAAFARLLRRLYGHVKRPAAPELSGVEGRLWHG